MRNVRDSFLRFLADNLQTSNIPVHNVRRDTDNPDANQLQNNAVNVTFLNANLTTTVSQQVVSVDVVANNELSAIDWATTLWRILSGAFMTPCLDYTNSSSPVPTGTNVFWNRTSIRFRPVADDFFFRYTATFPLETHI